MKTYPLFKVHTPKGVMNNIKEVFDSGFINEGIQVTQLTQQLQSILNSNKLILTNSCTSALTLALKLAGVTPHSYVITTPMTCVATNTPIINLGANITWADIDPKSGMMSVDDLDKKLSEWGHSIKAIMAVAWAGTPPDLEVLRAIANKHNLPLILDAAHAFGATYKGKQMHEWADYTCYSFQAIKHFTTGDGGALICTNDDQYIRSKSLKWFGLDRDKAKDDKGNWKGQQWDVDIKEAGFKFNMNNISAAIGLAQIKHIDTILNKHKQNAALYDKYFKDYPNVKHASRPDDCESSFWVYTMLLQDGVKLSRDELLNTLNAEGIMAGVVHVPNDYYSAFVEYKTDLVGVRDFSSRQFSLPCGWWLKKSDITHISNRVKELTR
jgi:dTDP-4-amino-4,6-dideoxygalactose transaminase